LLVGIVRIDDEKAVKTVSIIRNVEPSSETENETYAKAAQFASDALETKDFTALAKEKGYEDKPVMKIGRFEDNLPGIGRNREIVRWLYNNDRKVGDVSQFNNEKGYVIVYVTDMQDKGLMSAEEASPLVKPIILKEKKAGEVTPKEAEPPRHNPSITMAEVILSRFMPPYSSGISAPKSPRSPISFIKLRVSSLLNLSIFNTLG